jgi:hypothetical protein
MGRSTMMILLVYHIVLGSISIYMILGVWPDAISLTQNRTVNLFRGLLALNLNAELTLLLVVVFAGIIGAFVHSIGSISWHRSQRDLEKRWTVWYATRPFIGVGLALSLYFLLRAGFLSLGADPSAINIYGVAGISGIAGMFTNKATLKLKDIANTLLKT